MSEYSYDGVLRYRGYIFNLDVYGQVHITTRDKVFVDHVNNIKIALALIDDMKRLGYKFKTH